MIHKLWRAKPTPSADPETPQSAKARLVLELINKKVLPPPGGHFAKELQKLAATGTPTAEKDRKLILGSLGKHVSGYDAKPPRPAASKPAAAAPAPRPPQPARLKPQLDIPHLDKLAGLEDQHPAVIEQRLARLDPKERRAQLARLSGETARHVSMLSWQREAPAKRP